MAFIDELKFKAIAGRGGDGVVRWRQEKFIAKGGPNGGDGGRGGNVIIEAVRDVMALSHIKGKVEFKAEDGFPGEGASRHGAKGEHLTINVPVGSVVINLDTGWEYEFTEVGQKETILTGGGGGRGNEHFKSSTNQAPRQATKGRPGSEAKFKVELRLFADLGLVGFPNAGKSSLINALTNSKSKIGDYAFTTLDPNLGDFFGHIIADIPGVIEGAHEGKGLGSKFLRHITRTKMLAHLISFEHALTDGATGMSKAYKAIREELKKYGKGLTEKEEIIILTKTDMVDQKIIDREIKKFQKLSDNVFVVSLYDDNSVKDITKHISQILDDSKNKEK